MKTELKQLLYSRHKCSISTINRMMEQGDVELSDLSAVLGDTIAADMLNVSKTRILSMPGGGIYEAPEQGNLVVLWGTHASGRSSVIASLLSLKDMTPILPVSVDETTRDIQSRMQLMTRFFKCEDRYQALPSMAGNPVEVYHARYKRGLRTYNLSFLEANVHDWTAVNEILKTNTRQIHLFCIDCRQDIDQQVDEHKLVTKQLIEAGHLQQAAGVYVLVTKADLMNTPEPYLDNAVQTMVTTTGAADFWHMIRNKCKETYIYNEQPIVCSVGDYVLTDYARLDHNHTQRLCDEYILPKCEHRHWGLVRLLKMGSKKMAAIVALCVLALLAIAAAKFINVLDKPPTRELEPFDYVDSFTEEVSKKLRENVDYEEACEAYRLLRNDLDIERSILLKGKSHVLSDNAFNRCDRKLSDAFSRILNSRMQAFFNTDNWSQDTAFIYKALTQLNELYSHHVNMDINNASDCGQYRDYLMCYRDTVRHVINKMSDCSSVSDVETLVPVAKRLMNEYPYSNDTELNDQLMKVPYEAYFSCTQSLIDQVGQVLNNYSNNWFDEMFGSSTYSADDVRRLKDEVDALYEIVNQDNLSEEYDEIISELYDLQMRLEDALD
ncbi:MAG: hypothetical protein IKX18_03590 [Muribaculaceae bacterium]|nr:hypothetical protein [Muribaculaceae bacterium]